MANVVEEIPAGLRPAAEAALAWINRERDARFELTGLVPPDDGVEDDQPLELGLVLCDGEVCVREQVSVQTHDEGFQVRLLDNPDVVIPPHLDPPAGVRESWLESQLARNPFIVLVFYRGFW
jgi:hypothetical protein